MTMEYRPDRDGLPEANRIALVDRIADKAEPVLLADNRTTVSDAASSGRESSEAAISASGTADKTRVSQSPQAAGETPSLPNQQGDPVEHVDSDDDANQDGDISPAGQYALMRIAAGATPEEIDKEMGGLEEPSPLLDPVNIVVDAATGGAAPLARQGVRTIVKGVQLAEKEAVKEGGKLILKSVADDVGTGLVASGIGSAVEAAGGDKVMQEVAGIIGPHAASALGQMSRKATAQFLKQLEKKQQADL